MQLYLAGPLFTQAERAWNRAVAERLSEAGHRVFLPQDAVKGLDRLEADAIFRLDVEAVGAADAVVAIVDGADADSGTSFEVGLAFALGIPVVIVRTDFRGGGDALPGQRLATVNLMLAQAATAVIHLPEPSAHVDALADAVRRTLAELPSPPAPPSRTAR